MVSDTLTSVPTYKLTIHPDVVVLPEDTATDTTTDKTKLENGSTTGEIKFDCNTVNLQKGSKGETVKELQTILKARGYYTRQIDGDFGKYTKQAVQKLQKAQGNTQDGWFGKKTCQKLQQTSPTSNQDTNTENKKQKDYTITAFTSVPSISDDIEGISHECTLKFEYNNTHIAHIRKLQKTTFNIIYEGKIIKTHNGYINEVKITHENDKYFIELSLVSYTVFLEQTLIVEEHTAKRSELLKELIELAGLKANIDLSGLPDDEYTLKVQTTTNTTTDEGGITTVNGNDCTDTLSISARSYDIDTCHGNTKIGNSSANYAQDTKNMTAKEAIMDVYNRFHYGPSPTSSKVYKNNRRCPQTMWNKSGVIYGNCADISRLIKCMGEVHGLKVGIRHAPEHYYNLIEINGQTYKFDLCFKSGTTSRHYGNEVCNTLTMRGGPWQ